MGQLGTMLTRAREARGLTIDDAERDTRISKRYLAALEAEEFEVIPAPVYARGFLRSYSQYLGLNPNDALSLFPRDDDGAGQQQQPARPSNQTPVSPVSASRPAWKRPAQPAQQAPAPSRPRPRQAPAPAPAAAHLPDPDWEPTIGIDIGVPAPARRIRTDPAAQTRTAAVAVVAICAVLGVLLLAFIISQVAGGSEASPVATPTEDAALGGDAPAATATGAPSGEVPSVVGMQADVAKTTIEAAGFRATELVQDLSAPEGQVTDQAPVAGSSLDAGSVVTIIVSDGP